LGLIKKRFEELTNLKRAAGMLPYIPAPSLLLELFPKLRPYTEACEKAMPSAANLPAANDSDSVRAISAMYGDHAAKRENNAIAGPSRSGGGGAPAASSGGIMPGGFPQTDAQRFINAMNSLDGLGGLGPAVNAFGMDNPYGPYAMANSYGREEDEEDEDFDEFGVRRVFKSPQE
jgi:hypothetical protein